MKNKYTIGIILKVGIFKIFLFMARLITLLPFKIILSIGRMIGICGYYLSRKPRLITLINLEICFPDMPKHKRKALAIESFQSLGMGLMETAYAWYAPNDRMPPGDLRGAENIEKALNNNESVIMLGIHQVSSELTGKMYGLFRPFNAVYQKSTNPIFDKIILKQREKNFISLIANNKVRTMIKALNNKEMLWFAPDQGQRGKHCVFVPFFGVDSASSTSTSTLARLTDATVIPVSSARKKDLSGYELIVHPKIEKFPGRSLKEDAIKINQIYEDIIRKNPEQYLWQYKRFKHTPDDSPNVYDKRI